MEMYKMCHAINYKNKINEIYIAFLYYNLSNWYKVDISPGANNDY